MVRDHDEIYDELLEEKRLESVRGQQKKGSTAKPPEKNPSPSEDMQYPTPTPKKTNSVIKIASLNDGGDISSEKIMARSKSNPLVKNLELEQEKMSTLPKNPKEDFVPPKKAKDLPKYMKMAKGGKVSSASKRADGIATKGKTKGRIV